MKRFLIIVLVLLFNKAIGQKIDSTSVIGKSFKIEQVGNMLPLVVAQNDLPDKIDYGYSFKWSWSEAAKNCEKLGKGWRLPTPYELKIMHKNKSRIGGFSNDNYWSSSQVYSHIEGQRTEIIRFSDGMTLYSGYDAKNDCRCVRSFSSSTTLTDCFQNENDVKTYVAGKSFETENADVIIKFLIGEVIFIVGKNEVKYRYDVVKYLGSGHKGMITLTALSDGSHLILYISCREKVLTDSDDNRGTIMYEKSE
jgi:hypothetical protein